jgi:hypothetical protein
LRFCALLLVSAVSFLWIGADAGARCLSYEPIQVSLDGTLVTRSLPGPPGYVNIARGDHPETIVILVLDQPICVKADSTSISNTKAHSQVTEVQLVMGTAAYRTLVDKRVRATGTLFSARSRHHRTPVVMTVMTKRAL